AAQASVHAGADFLGFNFVPETTRTISVGKAKEIAQAIKGKVQTVGIFQNAPLAIVNAIIDELKLDFVQLHGSESVAYCKNVATRVIKKISVSQHDTFVAYDVSYFLFDRNKKDDVPLDFEKVRRIGKEKQFFLAGGLTAANVRSYIEQVHPFGVDVARGIETNGREEIEKIVAFVQAAKGGQL
ncbi:MAG: phosphoribosylanthranilate isomerase, partial [Candidatus Levyibacteriota bacterium]